MDATRDTQRLWCNGALLTQQKDVFPLCMDSVLLADFAKQSGGVRICELGCGCGIISLLLALSLPKSKLLALDISKSAAELSLYNMEQNSLRDRVQVRQLDLCSFSVPNEERFDLIVCNPPYFPKDSGKEPEKLKQARQEQICDIGDVCKAARRIARNGASLVLSYRPERLTQLIEVMRGSGFEPKRLRFVHHSVMHTPSVVLIEGKAGARAGALSVMSPLVIYGENGKHSAEFLEIYKMEEQQ